jgi:protein TonB
MNKHYPGGEQGTVRLALTIDRGGHVVSARVIGSSGSSSLDQTALQMARSASCSPMETSVRAFVSFHFHS